MLRNLSLCIMCVFFRSLTRRRHAHGFKKLYLVTLPKAMKNYMVSDIHQPAFCFMWTRSHISTTTDSTSFNILNAIRGSYWRAPRCLAFQAEILKDDAAPMTAAFTQTQASSVKRNEKLRLEHILGTVMMNLLSVPDGENGKRACTFFNKQITENVKDLKEWFLHNPYRY